MLTSLGEFEAGLAEIIGRPSALRPFVCEGSPLTCDMFIVGYNPATSMEGDWWRFWKSGYGYQKSIWFKQYLSERGELSKTRRKIEEIVGQLPSVRVLEANIDARPSKRKSEYPKPLTVPFEYVLKSCDPKVILAHGTDAGRHLQSWGARGQLLKCKHFIYVGKDRTKEIISEIRHKLS